MGSTDVCERVNDWHHCRLLLHHQSRADPLKIVRVEVNHAVDTTRDNTERIGSGANHVDRRLQLLRCEANRVDVEGFKYHWSLALLLMN